MAEVKTTKTVKKETKKPVEKVTEKAAVAEVKAAPKSGLSVDMLSLDGKTAGSLDLPKELFGAKINSDLLAQALRVYLANSRGHFGHTKTRGEVEGSTRKIWKQKGTGRARHGAVRAPIFVGGGIALGPRTRRVALDLPEKMKKAALVSALSQKVKDGEVVGVKGLESSTGKTKEMAQFIGKLQKKTVLLIADEAQKAMAQRAVKNLQGVDLVDVKNVNAFSVLRHQGLVLTKEAADKLGERLVKGEGK